MDPIAPQPAQNRIEDGDQTFRPEEIYVSAEHHALPMLETSSPRERIIPYVKLSKAMEMLKQITAKSQIHRKWLEFSIGMKCFLAFIGSSLGIAECVAWEKSHGFHWKNEWIDAQVASIQLEESRKMARALGANLDTKKPVTFDTLEKELNEYRDFLSAVYSSTAYQYLKNRINALQQFVHVLNSIGEMSENKKAIGLIQNYMGINNFLKFFNSIIQRVDRDMMPCTNAQEVFDAIIKNQKRLQTHARSIERHLVESVWKSREENSAAIIRKLEQEIEKMDTNWGVRNKGLQNILNKIEVRLQLIDRKSAASSRFLQHVRKTMAALAFSD